MLTALTSFRASFEPLRHRNLRLYLGGQAISLLGTWMQVTAQAWVVWQLSQSNQALGVVGMLAFLPFLFLGPWAGVWADRLDRRRVLVLTQTAAMILAFILAGLSQFNLLQLWHVYALATLLGVVNALDLPTQQAFIGDLSGMDQVRQAVVINSMIVQISRMIGPSLAGLVIARVGVSSAFWLNGVSFLAVIASLLLVRSRQIRKPSSGHPISDFREGLRFICSQPRIQDLMVFTGLMTFFGMSTATVLPAIATNVLHGGPDTYGLLGGASGAGALFGALIIVPLAQQQRRVGLVIGVATMWTGLWLGMFSFATSLPVAMLCFFLGSSTVPVVITTANGLLQVLAPADMRARVISTWLMVSFGIQPFAQLVIGFNADHLGPAGAIRLNAALLILGALLVLVARLDLRRWEIAIDSRASARAPVRAVQPE